MTRDKLINSVKEYVSSSSGNYISSEAAISPDLVGMKIFDEPIFAFGCVNDTIYAKLKDEEAIGSHFMPPLEWMDSAKTAISIFFPYSDQIKTANSKNYDWPADEWLHARYDGQTFLKEAMSYINSSINNTGYKSLIPSFDERFKLGVETNRFTSNWSERHIAYACGLGTFGLSKGLITEKGVCGRFGSIVTELDLPKDVRKYTEIYEYCTMCQKCVTNCPPNAISDAGKDDLSCSDFIDTTLDKHRPMYGCGKCQVGVPCMSTTPGARG